MPPPAPDLVRSLEAAELAACRSSTAAAPAETARDLGLSLADLGSALAVRAKALDFLSYNRVVGLGVASPATESQLDEAIEFFRASAAPRFMVHEVPGAEPRSLSRWLAARGFHPHDHSLRLFRRTTREGGPADARVRLIGREHAGVFARTSVEAFEDPPTMIPWLAATVGRDGWHHFGSFEDGAAVGFAAMFIVGPVAWFGFTCTRASHRRRGVHSGLIRARLGAAAALGCELVSVETADDTPEKPNPSTHNLRRAGFEDAYRRPNWVIRLGADPPS